MHKRRKNPTRRRCRLWKAPSLKPDFDILEMRNGPTETIGAALSLAFLANSLPIRDLMQPDLAGASPFRHVGTESPSAVLEAPLLHPHSVPLTEMFAALAA